MFNKLEVTIEIIMHATEDITKFTKSFEEIFEKVEFINTQTVGYFDNPITILSAKLERIRAQKFIRKLVELLSDEQINQMIQEIEERTVDSKYHIRFDKQELIKGNLVFKEKDALKLKIYTPIYNKRDKVKNFSKIFQIVN